MTTDKTHSQFHRSAASSARHAAYRLFVASGYDRTHPKYAEALTFDRLADQHDLAAGGSMAFADCPDCDNLRHQDH